ncbi:MAG TPA: serine hydrolase [Chryseosolibacter sp.]|nr:serine hydrolase [Chryseosolibacter sp.]
MRIIHLLIIGCLYFSLSGCDESDVAPQRPAGQPADTIAAPEEPVITEPYFPPISGDTWEAVNPGGLGWNSDSLNSVLRFLGSTNTYGFIILYKGRIAAEHYWNDWNLRTKYPVASAAKSITAMLIGIAQDKGLVDVKRPTSDFLGTGWTALPLQKESLIRLHHHLSMTTGLDESEDQCVSPACLKYKTDPGQRWVYHNAPYNLLHAVLEKVSGKNIDEFTRTALAAKIGMQNWSWSDHTLELSTRDMARFGLLIQNEGTWSGTVVLKSKEYFKDMFRSSNPFNKAYGLLWWLNGKGSYMIPGQPEVKNGKLVPSAPADMVAAMGKGDIKVYIVPGQDLVVVRHGADTGTETFGPSSFDEALWSRLVHVFRTQSN